MATGLPRWSEAFEYGKGTKAVAGVFELVYQREAHVQVNTDRGPVRCKGQDWSFRGNFVRHADGTMHDAEHPHFVRNQTTLAEPTDAVRKLVIEAGRKFAEAQWDARMDAAGELASAEREFEYANRHVESAQAELVKWVDVRDRAKAQVDKAMANMPTGMGVVVDS